MGEPTGGDRPGDASPRGVALRMLDELLGNPSRPHREVDTRAGRSISLAEFQEAGVARLHGVLARRGGAVLADSVGLGKTYMALALVEDTLRDGGQAVIVVPAAVRGMWLRPLRSLPATGAGWRLLSHTQLARGAAVPVRAGGAARIVVVDEAHRFRNPRTARYGALTRLIASGSGVPVTRALLLTATPVNNRPSDLLHLIRLFAADDAFRDIGVPSLREAFGALHGQGGDSRRKRGDTGADRGIEEARVAAVVREVVVRRTRALLMARFGDGESLPRFPARAPPRVIRYDDPGLPAALAAIEALTLPVYLLGDGRTSSNGGASHSAVPAAGLIRIGLLKRLDSSPAAFRASVLRLAQVTRSALEAAEQGRVLVPSRAPARSASADADPLQLALVELVADSPTPDLDLPGLVRRLRQDLEVLERLVRPRQNLDPKLRSLERLLDDLVDEQTLVFTEHRDTAAYLSSALCRRYRVARVDGSGAWLGGRRAGRQAVVECFAPHANGRRSPPERERVNVLIATDVLAEGVNLQDARNVVSYDLPWNPVRLLQRIGRVDRLDSRHSEIAAYLFVPERGLDAMLGLMRRLRRKLDDITTIVGDDHADAILEGLVQGKGGMPSRAPSVVSAHEASNGPIEALRTLRVAAARGGFGVEPGDHPVRAAIELTQDHPGGTLEWIVLMRDAAGTALLEVDREGVVRPAGGRTVAVLRDVLSGLVTVCGVRDDPPVESIRAARAALCAALRAPGPLPSHAVGARLARRIRETLALTGVGVDPGQVARVDRLLHELARPLNAVQEEEARSILRTHDLQLSELLDLADRLIGPGTGRPTPPQGRRAAAELEVVAALHIAPTGPLRRG